MKYETYLDIPAWIRRGRGLTKDKYQALIKAGFTIDEIVGEYHGLV